MLAPVNVDKSKEKELISLFVQGKISEEDLRIQLDQESLKNRKRKDDQKELAI